MNGGNDDDDDVTWSQMVSAVSSVLRAREISTPTLEVERNHELNDKRQQCAASKKKAIRAFRLLNHVLRHFPWSNLQHRAFSSVESGEMVARRPGAWNLAGSQFETGPLPLPTESLK